MADHFSRPLRLTRIEALAVYLRGTELLATPGMPDAPSLARRSRSCAASLGAGDARRGRGADRDARRGRAPEHLEALRDAARGPRAPGDRVLRGVDGGVERRARSIPKRSSRHGELVRGGVGRRCRCGAPLPRRPVRSATPSGRAVHAPRASRGRTRSVLADRRATWRCVCACGRARGGSPSTTPPPTIEEREDGGLEVTLPPRAARMGRRLLLRVGDDAEVVEPAGAGDRVQRARPRDARRVRPQDLVRRV